MIDGVPFLKPVEIQRNVTLLRSWIVNDPTGKWRVLRYLGTRPLENGELMYSFAVDESDEAVFQFEIPMRVAGPREISGFWIDQEKDQWKITEWIEK